MALTASATNPAEVPRHFALPVLAVMTGACHALQDRSLALTASATVPAEVAGSVKLVPLSEWQVRFLQRWLLSWQRWLVPFNFECSKPEINSSIYSGETITRSYRWNYQRTTFSWKLTISKSLYDYYKAQPHDRSKFTTYKEYAISSRDKPYLDSIIKKLKETGKSKGYSESDNVMNVVAFVQALPYFKDSASTTYDEYPRYPIETLVDNGGDCEDTAILTAAMLREMGYGVVLINPPKHMAVGVKCDSCTGTYYTYQGEKYYYLETTGNNFQIGQIPKEYANTKVGIIPLN